MTEVMSYVCPFCGCEVRVGKPCPGCAKKVKKSGKKPWEQDESKDGLDLPDGDFNYEDFIAREFGKASHRVLGLKWYWWVLAVALLLAMIWGVIAQG
jgi:hypothetical protein